ncbi:MAG: ABC transporter substrate-binding protein [Deltaproteobacteria bacterium]|nr:ABC transporter substrate-binding protein [Deltaproteobacteria bacterium]
MNNNLLIKRILFFTSLCLLLLSSTIGGCVPNNPYRSSESNKNIFYKTFSEAPKHLDPARSYYSDEFDILAQIYEPLIQYHYLKRPYELVPLTAKSVPTLTYFDKDKKTLPDDVSPEKVDRAVYEISIKEGIMYQNHPAFAKDADGRALFTNITEKDLKGISEITDFPKFGTRELIAEDYIYQIMRLADPQLHCPILPMLENYILGLDEYAESLKNKLAQIRATRKADAGLTYNQSLDEKKNPIIIDYKKFPLPGVVKIDKYKFKIILKKKYPQFIYWLAMPFFSPMPEEANLFYKQGPLQAKNITLNRFPVGTGPYRFEKFNPNMEIRLKKNENFHGEKYPSEGEPSDKKNGLLDDAFKTLPLIDEIVFKLEKEAIPRWNKFLQGYFDTSGIASDSFDQAVTISASGGARITKIMEEKGISLSTSIMPSTYYMGFNMQDSEVGGYSEKKQKLRQAISIALDYEEFIEIFTNGRAISAMGPLPPGIFGHKTGKEGINPLIYDWDVERKKPVRKSIEFAKELLSEAGFPGGRKPDGTPLIITFDNAWTGASSKQTINWFIKRFALLGIQLENRTTDGNRYQEKLQKGNFQFFFLGWFADYPDPENFLFLLHGPNGKVDFKGENASNYSNPEFDRLFKKMENINNSPERLKIVEDITKILRKDSPWVWGYHPVSFALIHNWVGNIKPNTMANNTMKYLKIDRELRENSRKEWNKPNLIPVLLFFVLLIAISLPALFRIWKKLGYSKKG